jgi:hypothetical protein
VAGLAEENGRILLANSKSAEMWVSNMPSFEKEKGGKLAQEKVLLEL